MMPARARLLRVAARAFEAAIVTAAVATSAVVSAAAGVVAGDCHLLDHAERSIAGLSQRTPPTPSAVPERLDPAFDDFVKTTTGPASEEGVGPETEGDRRKRAERERKRAERERKRAERERKRAERMATEVEGKAAVQVAFPWGADASADTPDSVRTRPRTDDRPLSDLKSSKKKGERSVGDVVRADMPIPPECVAVFEDARARAGVDVGVDAIWTKFVGHFAGKEWGPKMVESKWRDWVADERALRRPLKAVTGPPPSGVVPTSAPGERETRALLRERKRWEREGLDDETTRQLAQGAIRTLDAPTLRRVVG